MASQEQLENQEELNKAFEDYKNNLYEAGDFLALLTSRTSELANYTRLLTKSTQDFGSLQKSISGDISKSFNITKNLSSEYSSIKDITDDTNKVIKNQNSLRNSSLALEKQLSKEGIKNLKEINSLEEKRGKLETEINLSKGKTSANSLDNINKAVEASNKLIATQKDLSQAFSSMSQEEQNVFNEKKVIIDDLQSKQKQAQNELLDSLKNGNADEIKAKEQAFKTASSLLSNYTAVSLSENDEILLALKNQEQEYKKIEQSANAILNPSEKELATKLKTLSTLNEEIEGKKSLLSPNEQLYDLALKSQEVNEKSLGYLEKQESQTKNLISAQSLFNNTLGTAGDVLNELGAGNLVSILGIDKGKEAAAQMADKLTDGGKKSLGLFGKMRVAVAGFGAALSSALGPMALIGNFVKMFKEGEESIKRSSQASVDFSKQMGVSVSVGKQMYKTSSQIAGEIGALAENVQKNTAALQQQLGTTANLGKSTLKTYNQLVEKGGYSVETAAEFTRMSQLSGKSLESNTAEMIGQIEAFKSQNNVALDTKGTMELIAKTSTSTRLTFKNSASELAKAAAQAKKMGLEMSKLESIGESLLNFEDSISKEMEAELLIGRDINLEKARQFALEGKIGDVAAEISKQIGSAAEFSKMNVIQQKALAESVGMTKDELAGALETQELLAGTGFSDMNQATARFNELLKEGKSIEEAKLAIGNETLANQLAATSYAEQQELRQRNIQDSFAKVAQALMPIVEVFRELAQKLAPVIANLAVKLLDGFKPILDLVIKLANRFGDFISNIVDKLVPIIGNLVKVFSPILDVITDMVFAVSDGLLNSIEAIITIVGDLIAKLAGPLSKVIEVIAKLFSGPIMDAITNIMTSVLSLIDKLAGPLSKIIEVIAGLFSGPIMTAITNIITSVVDLISELSGPLMQIVDVIIKLFSGPIIDAIAAIITSVVDLISKLSGPLVQIIDVIAKVFSGPIINAITSIITSVVDLISQLSGPLSQVINVIAGIFSGPIMNAITSIITSVVDLISKLSGPLTQIIDIIAKLFSGPIMTAITAIITSVVDLISKLSGPLTQIIDVIAKIFSGPIMDAITSIVLTIGDLISKLSGPLTQIIDLVAKMFSGPIMDAIIRIVDVVADLISKLSGPLSQVITVVAELANKIFQALIPIIPVVLELVTMFMDMAMSILPPILDLVIDLVENVLPLMIPIIQLFADIVESLMPLIDPFIVLLTDVLVPILNVITSLFKGDISGAISGLSTVFDGLVLYAQTIFTSFITFFKNIFTSAGTYIYDMISNVFSGLGNIMGGIFKTPINLVIKGINLVIDGINSISVDLPDIVGGGTIGFDLSPLPLVEDGASVSKKGPFTIIDNNGNMAITHPEDKLVVSPNISYVNDAITSKQPQQVFPVSEKFGALDVKVSRKGVNVQKIKDGATSGGSGGGGGKTSPLQELSTSLKSFIPAIDSTFNKAVGNFMGMFDKFITSLQIFPQTIIGLTKLFTDLVPVFSQMSQSSSTFIKGIEFFISALTKLFNTLITSFKTFTETQIAIESSKDTNNPIFKDLTKVLSNIVEIKDGIAIPSIQSVQDGSSPSKGPYTIIDRLGNVSQTHPKDGLVVSPNISYVNDGVSGEKGMVFPVSEKFGALDVKVSPKGVMVQKIKDAVNTTNSSSLSTISSFSKNHEVNSELILNTSTIKPQLVQDGSSSSKGPYTIIDRLGNMAVTHPKDGLVVSPNISYVNDGVTNKRDSVFPVSEDFGALDVKVSPKGVMVQKVKDALTLKDSSTLKESSLLEKVQKVKDAFNTTKTDNKFVEKTKEAKEQIWNTYNQTPRSVIPGSPGVYAWDSNVEAMFTLKPEMKSSQQLMMAVPAEFIHKLRTTKPELIGLRSDMGFADPTKVSAPIIQNLVNEAFSWTSGGYQYKKGNESTLDSILDPFQPELIRDLIKGYAPVSPNSTTTFHTLDKKEGYKPGIVSVGQSVSEGLSLEDTPQIQKVEDGFFSEAKKQMELLSDPIGYMTDNLLSTLIEETIPLLKYLFKPNTLGSKTFKLLAKKIPYIGPIMELSGGALNMGTVAKSGQSLPKIKSDIGKIALETVGSLGGAVLGGMAGSFLGPVGTFIGSMVGSELGKFVLGYFSNTLGGPKLGDIVINNIPQLAEGGVVSKPTVALIGEAGPEAVVPLDQIAQESPGVSTTVVEPDNSDLKKELQEMKQLMADLIAQIPTIANRPIVVELNGNKVGQALGQNAYRI
jgi:phage-related protein